MKYFLEFVISALVEHQNEIDVEQVEEDSHSTTFYIRVHPSDIGKLIGKHGRTIGAIRTVLNAAAQDHQRVQVEIVEEAA